MSSEDKKRNTSKLKVLTKSFFIEALLCYDVLDDFYFVYYIRIVLFVMCFYSVHEGADYSSSHIILIENCYFYI